MQKIVLVCSVMIVVWLKMKKEKHMAALAIFYVHIHPLPSIYQGNICREIELFVRLGSCDFPKESGMLMPTLVHVKEQH